MSPPSGCLHTHLLRPHPHAPRGLATESPLAELSFTIPAKAKTVLSATSSKTMASIYRGLEDELDHGALAGRASRFFVGHDVSMPHMLCTLVAC